MLMNQPIPDEGNAIYACTLDPLKGLEGYTFLEKLQPGPGPGGRMDAAGNVCSREIGAGGGTRNGVRKQMREGERKG